jgi:transposase
MSVSLLEVNLPSPGRRRGRYSDEFKSRLIEACRQPGMSTAGVALANGINANVLRRWVVEAGIEESADLHTIVRGGREDAFVRIAPTVPQAPATSQSVRIELRRGEVSVVLEWPLSHVSQCATLLGAVLR